MAGAAKNETAPFCVFCEIVAGRIPSHKVWENGDFLAFLDIKPIRPGHILLVPRKHHDPVFDMPPALYDGIFQVARTLAIPLGKHFDVPRVGMIVEGFGMPHAHVHLVPISEAGQLNPALAHAVSTADLERTRDALAPALNAKG